MIYSVLCLLFCLTRDLVAPHGPTNFVSVYFLLPQSVSSVKILAFLCLLGTGDVTDELRRHHL